MDVVVFWLDFTSEYDRLLKTLDNITLLLMHQRPRFFHLFTYESMFLRNQKQTDGQQYSICCRV